MFLIVIARSTLVMHIPSIQSRGKRTAIARHSGYLVRLIRTPYAHSHNAVPALIESHPNIPKKHYLVFLSLHSLLPSRRRVLRRLILPTLHTTIRRLRLLQLHIIPLASIISVIRRRSVSRRRSRVVAVVVVRAWIRVRIVRLGVVGRCGVAWRSAAEGPAGSAVGLVSESSSAAGGDAAAVES